MECVFEREECLSLTPVHRGSERSIFTNLTMTKGYDPRASETPSAAMVAFHWPGVIQNAARRQVLSNLCQDLVL